MKIISPDFEGGWSDDPDDSGGATMKGITLETFRKYKNNTYTTKGQLRNISDADVFDIYHILYWHTICGDILPSGMDFVVFDHAVNASPARSIKMMQTLLGVTADSVIGPKTLAAVDACDVDNFILKFTLARMDYYDQIDNPKFTEGWHNRAKRACEFAQELRTSVS